jgi:uncharacterized membrane protein (UPF0182 family)
LKNAKKPVFGIIITLIIISFIFIKNIIDLIINIKWFKEVGYLSVYFTQLTATLKLSIPLFIICFIAVWIYYKGIRKSIVKYKKVIEIDLNRNKVEQRIIIISDLLISLFIAISFSLKYWYSILQFTNSQNFNTKDPIFNLDISFFIFKLPLIQSLYGTFMSLLIFLVISTFAIYIIMNVSENKISFRRDAYNDFKWIKSDITKFAGKQFAIVAALFLILLSLGFMIRAWNLVYSSRGVVFGASYTDTKISLRFYYGISIASIIGAIIVFTSIIRTKVKPIIVTLGLIFALVIVEGIVSNVVQTVIVNPNENTLESQYIDYNIQATRKAFNINDIEIENYPLENNLNADTINANLATIKNIRINAVDQSLEFYNSVQSIKNYYSFKDADIDRYIINGEYNQVFIAPREIDLSKLQDKSNTWQNKYLTYTHGYGIVMSKVNSVTSEGKPDFVMKDMPLENTTDISLDNPRIYFGETVSDYAIVNNSLGELDYPNREGNEEKYYYDGKAGINMSFINRVMFAIKNADMNFLLSTAIKSNSKVVINRNIMDRVNKIAPFLSYDNDPYLVVNNSKLYWIIDAYTESSRYPFSEPVSGINYIRNSVKVIIDAVDGTTDFYIVDENDPIVQCYSDIFPKLFKELSEVPEGFKEHLKYPEDLFLLQCKVMERYHVSDTAIFYRGEDIWDIAKNKNVVEGEDTINNAAYVTMKLPAENKEEMVVIEYFNQHTKENMISLMGARMDGDNYGKIVLYIFPTANQEVISPSLFKSSINQQPEISKELSLWNKEGSEVQYGDTMIIPIENSLLYVQPLYLRSQGEKSIPQMKKIILYYNGKIIMEDNIEDALSKLFDYNKVIEETQDKVLNKDNEVSEEVLKSVKEANDLYNKAIEAQKNGDWSKYGEYIEQLGSLLKELSE